MGTRELIEEFLKQKRLALVGVSRDPKDFSHRLFIEFLERDYEAVPVNPKAVKIAGQPCYENVCAIPRPVGGALLLLPPHLTAWVVRGCARVRIPLVWMHRGAGDGAINDEAVAYCQQHSIRVIEGFCPYMFLSHPGLVHRAHGWMMRLEGTYPARSGAA